MSWLFCCGDSKLQQQEKKTTIDLSIKPQMPQYNTDDLKVVTDDYSGLSPDQNEQSKLLSDILAAQKRNKEENTKLGKGYKGQPIFTTESADSADSTPFGKAIRKSSNMEGDNQSQNAQQARRIIHDKRLNNFLMQAQKMMQNRNTANTQSQEDDEDNITNSKTQQFHNGSSEFRTIVVEDTDQGFALDTQVSKQAKQQNTSKKPTKKSAYRTQTYAFDKQRRSQMLLNSHEEDKLKHFDTIEERKEYDSKTRNSNPQQFTLNHDYLASAIKDEGISDLQKKMKSMPLSAKNDQKVDNIFAQAQKQSTKNNATKINDKAATNNNGTRAQLNKTQTAVKIPQTTKNKTSTKQNKNLNTTSKVNHNLNNTVGNLGQNQAIINIEQAMNMSLESAELKQINNEVAINQTAPISEQIFPSQQSEFSFQPKYFKPQTNNAIINNKTNSSVISQNNSGIVTTHFNESLSNNTLLKRNNLNTIFANQDTNVQSLLLQSEKSEQTAESYPSGTSTLIPNSRNPSIIPPKNTQEMIKEQKAKGQGKKITGKQKQ